MMRNKHFFTFPYIYWKCDKIPTNYNQLFYLTFLVASITIISGYYKRKSIIHFYCDIYIIGTQFIICIIIIYKINFLINFFLETIKLKILLKKYNNFFFFIISTHKYFQWNMYYVNNIKKVFFIYTKRDKPNNT